jgi:HAD superfamily hydrolase (TIGR01509 family)
MGSDHLLDHVLGADRDHDADPAIAAAHTALYAQYWSRLTPLPDAKELLRECARRNWTVVLASSASEREFAVMRDALGAEDAIAAATHAADVEASKPAPDLVRQALEQAEADADRAVFVGDAVWDGQAAARAGVAFIGLESGGVSRAELTRAGARQVFADPADLLAHIDDSLLAQPRRP